MVFFWFVFFRYKFVFCHLFFTPNLDLYLMKKLAVAAVMCSLLSSYAVAGGNSIATNKYQGFYVGGGVGTTDFHDDLMSEASKRTDIGISSKSDTAYKLITGYQFNRIVSIEAQYTSYGDTKYSAIKNDQKANMTVKQQSYSIAANVGYTFDNGLRPFVTAGLGQISVKSPMINDDGGLVRLGAGLEYQIKQVPGLGMRVAYEADFYTLEDKYNNKDYDQSVGSWYVGTTYKF